MEEKKSHAVTKECINYISWKLWAELWIECVSNDQIEPCKDIPASLDLINKKVNNSSMLLKEWRLTSTVQ
jgi:hypothetical protein